MYKRFRNVNFRGKLHPFFLQNPQMKIHLRPTAKRNSIFIKMKMIAVELIWTNLFVKKFLKTKSLHKQILLTISEIIDFIIQSCFSSMCAGSKETSISVGSTDDFSRCSKPKELTSLNVTALKISFSKLSVRM